MSQWLASVLMFAAVSSWAAIAPAGNASSPMATPSQAQASEAKAAAPVVKAEKILVAANVENREPVGDADTFGPEFCQVYCWTRLTVSEPPAMVKFVWSLDGKQVYEHPLEIKTSGRWWATKKVQPGAWKVEIKTEGGESLGSAEFTVTAEAAPAAAAPAPAPAAK